MHDKKGRLLNLESERKISCKFCKWDILLVETEVKRGLWKFVPFDLDYEPHQCFSGFSKNNNGSRQSKRVVKKHGSSSGQNLVGVGGKKTKARKVKTRTDCIGARVIDLGEFLDDD